MKLITVLLFVSSLAVAACPPHTVEYNGGCYVDLPAEKDTTPSVQPLDEKPPSDKMPSYQRVGINALTPPSLAAQDARDDEEKSQADTQGKKSAGLKQ